MAHPSEIDTRALGKHILNLRLARDMSQTDLAYAARVSPSYISKLESGRTQRPGAEIIERIARALGLSDWRQLMQPPPVHKGESPPTKPPTAIATSGPTPSYAVAIPVVAVANAGRGGGIVEEWAFMPFEATTPPRAARVARLAVIPPPPMPRSPPARPR